MNLYCAIIVHSFSKTEISHFLLYKNSLFYLAALLKWCKILVEFCLTFR